MRYWLMWDNPFGHPDGGSHTAQFVTQGGLERHYAAVVGEGASWALMNVNDEDDNTIFVLEHGSMEDDAVQRTT